MDWIYIGVERLQSANDEECAFLLVSGLLCLYNQSFPNSYKHMQLGISNINTMMMMCRKYLVTVIIYIYINIYTHLTSQWWKWCVAISIQRTPKISCAWQQYILSLSIVINMVKSYHVRSNHSNLSRVNIRTHIFVIIAPMDTPAPDGAGQAWCDCKVTHIFLRNFVNYQGCRVMFLDQTTFKMEDDIPRDITILRVLKYWPLGDLKNM